MKILSLNVPKMSSNLVCIFSKLQSHYLPFNIHHSFLPAFAGARPYRQAFERGVKLIGATAHFVTGNLDEGPIITQQTISIDHTYTVDEMVKAGQEVEKAVLNKAISLISSNKVFTNGNKTIVFE